MPEVLPPLAYEDDVRFSTLPTNWAGGRGPHGWVELVPQL